MHMLNLNFMYQSCLEPLPACQGFEKFSTTCIEIFSPVSNGDRIATHFDYHRRVRIKSWRKVSYPHRCRVCTGSKRGSPRSDWSGTCANASAAGTCPGTFATEQLCHCWCLESAGGRPRQRNPPAWCRPRGSVRSVVENASPPQGVRRTVCPGTPPQGPSVCCLIPATGNRGIRRVRNAAIQLVISRESSHFRRFTLPCKSIL